LQWLELMMKYVAIDCVSPVPHVLAPFT